MRRSGIAVALAVSAHNLPEGLATFVSTLDDPTAGAAVTLAIALHNIPEGIAVAVPLQASGVRPRRACAVAALSGMAEPLGVLLGYPLLITLLPASTYAVVFGLVAGIMLHLAVTELLPAAYRLTNAVTAAAASLAGAVTMAISLVLLGVA